MKVYIWLAVFGFILPGVFVDEKDRDLVFVTQRDSVTLNTGHNVTAKDKIKWFFNDTRIAQMNGDLSKTCTDVQCNEGTERFRDRLKLDHKTGSLTITYMRAEDAGDYRLLINSNNDKIFSVTVTNVLGSTDEESVSVKEGDSVTLNTDVKTNQQDKIKWFFNDTRIAYINGDLNFICTDVQCNEGTERFRDRLKLNNQTGSLTITNTRTTDSGLYKLEITSSRFSIHRHRRSISVTSVRSFSVSVIADSGLSSGAVTGIIVAVVLVITAAAGIYYWCSRKRRSEDVSRPKSPDLSVIPMMTLDTEMSSNLPDTPLTAEETETLH